MAHNDTVHILMVEDDPGHARLIERNLQRSGVTNDILIIDDGYDAVDYFFGENGYVNRTTDQALLILLDLNLPGLTGIQVLERLKADPRTYTIPVIILTTTEEPQEIQRCYELGCSVYITKPVKYEQFTDAIQKLGLFLSIIKTSGGNS
ncbi:response regulator [Candidatus Entotheonella palauensis]|uniref:response regulator n=1 Tax=Candidatus Entotheonella palauensis TaxID=93172 RepID=UPI000B7DE05B|nr:response regulator [Candidatus Entotheonella palauensis]